MAFRALVGWAIWCLSVFIIGAASSGCSLVIGTERREAHDAGPIDASTDGSPVACQVDAPFSAPESVAAFNTQANEESVRFSPDGLEAWVARRESHTRLRHFARTSRAASWSFVAYEDALTVFDGGMTSATNISVFPGGTDAVVQYYDNAFGRGALYQTLRAGAVAPWETPIPIAALASDAESHAPFVSQDGSSLYFQSNRNGAWRIYRAPRQGRTFGAATALARIHPDEDRSPVLSGDELTIYVSAVDYPAVDPPYTQRVYRATRATRDAAFGPAVEVAELSLKDYEVFPTWLSPDECEIWLVGLRPDGFGNSWDVYVARKPPRP